MHTKTVNLPAVSVFDIYVEEIPPKVVAKGRGYLADKIIEIAREHNIPIRPDKNLLQILSRLDLNDEIPTEIYKGGGGDLGFYLSAQQPAAD